ncbi:MAG: uncharacterized protein QOD99_751 [Chthoniobacter sp.]|nr:uncharacterized protein [Chthoniobacter sp.]
MRIAVISDTHDRVHPQLPALLTTADEIWHLGDVCDEAILDEFLAIGPPLKVVRGNCDSCSDWPWTLDLLRCGFRIHLVHIPPRGAPAGTHLLLHGHTHVPRNEHVGDTTFLNPGCLTRPNRGAPRSFGWLTLAQNEPWNWSLHRLD